MYAQASPRPSIAPPASIKLKNLQRKTTPTRSLPRSRVNSFISISSHYPSLATAGTAFRFLKKIFRHFTRQTPPVLRPVTPHPHTLLPLIVHRTSSTPKETHLKQRLLAIAMSFGLLGSTLARPVRADDELDSHKIKHVLLISVDGLHALDLSN